MKAVFRKKKIPGKIQHKMYSLTDGFKFYSYFIKTSTMSVGFTVSHITLLFISTIYNNNIPF